MIDGLFMHWRVEVLIKGVSGIELLMADIALPVVAIECPIGGRDSAILIVVISYLLLRDHAMRVTLTDHLEDTLAVQARGASAGTCLEMVRETASSSEGVLAKRTGNSRTAVDF